MVDILAKEISTSNFGKAIFLFIFERFNWNSFKLLNWYFLHWDAINILLLRFLSIYIKPQITKAQDDDDDERIVWNFHLPRKNPRSRYDDGMRDRAMAITRINHGSLMSVCLSVKLSRDSPTSSFENRNPTCVDHRGYDSYFETPWTAFLEY